MLLTGGAGLLGGRLAQRLAESFHLVAAAHAGTPAAFAERVAFDLRSAQSLEQALDAARPASVVHAAAVADPDLCERDPELARRVNVEGTAALARACARRGVALVALSTDYVFDGSRAFQGEDDAPRPLSVYGRTKLEAEEAVLASGSRAAVARVPLVTGRGHGPRGTASEAIAWALRAGRRVRLFTDQWRTPVDADSVAEAVMTLVRNGSAGRFHLAGPERVSRYGLGLRVAAVLHLPPDLIEPVSYEAKPGEATRPADVSLDGARTRAALGWSPRSLEAAILLGRGAPDIIAPRS